jgi:hypothetical protein
MQQATQENTCIVKAVADTALATLSVSEAAKPQKMVKQISMRLNENNFPSDYQITPELGDVKKSSLKKKNHLVLKSIDNALRVNLT